MCAFSGEKGPETIIVAVDLVFSGFSFFYTFFLSCLLVSWA